MSLTTSQDLDDQDIALAMERFSQFNAKAGPRVGDFVRFADGTLRRISHHWRDDEGWDGGVQTSDGGSFYFARGHCSFSGSLRPSIPTESLRDTGETMPGLVWFFHHDIHRAHNGVTFSVECRVFETAELPS